MNWMAIGKNEFGHRDCIAMHLFHFIDSFASIHILHRADAKHLVDFIQIN